MIKKCEEQIYLIIAKKQIVPFMHWALWSGYKKLIFQNLMYEFSLVLFLSILYTSLKIKNIINY